MDNHYMVQAMSDEPIDLGVCKRYVFGLASPAKQPGKGR